ncbi:MAG TPA: tRNA (adenosine(37)-N6)-threonylcarbamoyltransferase complex dimerization subunit type 1 TsaB [Desulfobacteraceae bacterium]|nr:tRNA (adenosine(37)-N6)-threonylcarbamoyltransferase complex dimerization subunit type 1 TsaB [Desulfobacteraceae bacterium]
MDGVLILAIETATACGSVSLTSGGPAHFSLLAECSVQPDTSHSRRLLGSIAWLMTSTGAQWHDLDAVAVSLGPGSFTGLRIGMAAAKAIAMAAGKPLVGVPTLDALALACGGDQRLVCCLLDARKQEVYAAFYRLDNKGLPEPLDKPMVLPPVALLRDIREPVVVVGPGASVYREQLAGNDRIVFFPEHLAQPRAMYVGLLGARIFLAGDRLDPATAAPLYVRDSDAQVNLKRKGRQV